LSISSLVYGRLVCGSRTLELAKPQVMGVLNVTPDSFSDGGLFISVPEALQQARQMSAEGAAIIDVGGESTRPGASAVSSQEELDRIIPVIEAIHQELDVVVSVDTSKPEVMKAAVTAGAGMINDVRALREAGALQAAAEADVPVCLMHMKGEPRTMQGNPHYDDIVNEIKDFLRERIESCENNGIPGDRLLIDPGFGFGKTIEHNLTLVKRLEEFADLGKPILMGVSRKSTIGAITGRPVDQRVYASVALAALCCLAGAKLIRAHDVAATVDAINMTYAVMNVSQEG
jgi:dihydropteroate synthase